MVNRGVRFGATEPDVSEQSAMSEKRTLRHLKIVSTFNFSDRNVLRSKSYKLSTAGEPWEVRLLNNETSMGSRGPKRCSLPRICR
ncbi:Uncharacterised protein [Citrobacter koseri]|uniref:Uncharacterized protein n=1 Tax=Citrobacter koseri TaxID=545 RepID=A0A3S4J1H8_CITKO|nr:Uncharacterised protein [Citrobacter koseri]